MFEYIGYVHSTHNQYGYRKEIVYHVIAKAKGRYEVRRQSEYSGAQSSRWYNLEQLKRKIRKFDHITVKGNEYLEK